jgi:surface polysaccharide O-acyltransferase-like enzyme
MGYIYCIYVVYLHFILYYCFAVILFGDKIFKHFCVFRISEFVNGPLVADSFAMPSGYLIGRSQSSHKSVTLVCSLFIMLDIVHLGGIYEIHAD